MRSDELSEGNRLIFPCMKPIELLFGVPQTIRITEFCAFLDFVATRLCDETGLAQSLGLTEIPAFKLLHHDTDFHPIGSVSRKQLS